MTQLTEAIHWTSNRHTSWYSLRETRGTSILWVEGQRSSNFLPVKISIATRWTLAWPCLPVFEVLISTILHGRPLMTTNPFFLNAEHCCGKVVEAPASALSKVCSCYEEACQYQTLGMSKTDARRAEIGGKDGN